MGWRHKDTGKVKWAQVLGHIGVGVVLVVQVVLLVVLVMR